MATPIPARELGGHGGCCPPPPFPGHAAETLPLPPLPETVPGAGLGLWWGLTPTPISLHPWGPPVWEEPPVPRDPRGPNAEGRGGGWHGHRTQNPVPGYFGHPHPKYGVGPGPHQARRWVGTGCHAGPPQGVPVPPFPVTPAPGWSLVSGVGGGSPGHARAGPFVSRLVSQAQAVAILPPAQGHGRAGCHAPWVGGEQRPPPHIPVPGTRAPQKGMFGGHI